MPPRLLFGAVVFSTRRLFWFVLFWFIMLYVLRRIYVLNTKYTTINVCPITQQQRLADVVQVYVKYPTYTLWIGAIPFTLYMGSNNSIVMACIAYYYIINSMCDVTM